MATIVNSPVGGGQSGAGMIIGVVTTVAVAMVIVLVVYAVPAFRDENSARLDVPAVEVYKYSN